MLVRGLRRHGLCLVCLLSEDYSGDDLQESWGAAGYSADGSVCLLSYFTLRSKRDCRTLNFSSFVL